MTPKAITVLLLLIGLVACGGGNGTGGGDNTGDTSPSSPVITGFTASAAAITEVAGASLTAVFINGPGSIDKGVGSSPPVYSFSSCNVVYSPTGWRRCFVPKKAFEAWDIGRNS